MWFKRKFEHPKEEENLKANQKQKKGRRLMEALHIDAVNNDYVGVPAHIAKFLYFFFLAFVKHDAL